MPYSSVVLSRLCIFPFRWTGARPKPTSQVSKAGRAKGQRPGWAGVGRCCGRLEREYGEGYLAAGERRASNAGEGLSPEQWVSLLLEG